MIQIRPLNPIPLGDYTTQQPTNITKVKDYVKFFRQTEGGGVNRDHGMTYVDYVIWNRIHGFVGLVWLKAIAQERQLHEDIDYTIDHSIGRQFNVVRDTV